jgi:Transposase IS200 like
MTYFADKASIKLADNRSALSTPVTSSVVARNRPLMTVDLRGVAYAANRISSTLKGSTKQFGWLQAPATIRSRQSEAGRTRRNGFLKGKSAIAIARLCGKERNFTGEHFWARGYAVSTVGLELEQVRQYIREQEVADGSAGTF